jgi:peroxiredoxin
MNIAKSNIFCAVALSALSVTALPTWAQAQPRAAASSAPAAPAVGSAFSLASPTKDNTRYNLSASGGKPVLVMYWSTDCMVCKTKMADIRREASQANGRFEVVLVNTDRSWSTAEAYEKILQTTNGSSTGSSGAAKPVRIWRGDPNFADSLGAAVEVANRAPLTVVVNKQGRIAEVLAGRFDDGVWQRLRQM